MIVLKYRASDFKEGSARTIPDCVGSNLIEALNKWARKRMIRLTGESNFENCRIEAMKKRRDRGWKITRNLASTITLDFQNL